MNTQSTAVNRAEPRPHAEPRHRFASEAARGLSRPGVVGGLLLVGVIAFVLWGTLNLEAHSCEVCMEYQGRSQCREVAAATIEEARTGAILNACAFVASGMRDSMDCQRTRPASENCR